ncbi:MAG: caspase family protein [Pelatocladus maniniholoensis HA4357-MV3]|jgi:hypothetical protein|uniref:Caspase family protein n=1 Tax=Pelatocladus maniniholoensis HA4357-MV3 TaxID=1117104 RepID=A0A9E3H489_9NOST|nr:caspase family protein [Pelatocladus maniniholoensis HA4357-MV3]BAZ69463.1 hypothetical protein NIES4106_42350 [Fischerella sp. NIES-4106]
MAEYKILLVEDDLFWQDLLERKIRLALRGIDDPKSAITIVELFDQAYNTIKNDCWHLLVTDIGLGDPSVSMLKKGMHLADLAHELNIPVIAVSGTPGLSRKDVSNLYEKFGIFSFFDKLDFDHSSFITKVQAVLQKQITTSSQHQNSVQKPSQIPEAIATIQSNYYALVIGIANYHHIRPLSKTTNDASDLHETLIQNGYSQTNVTILLDQDATKAAISQKLELLASHVKAHDTVIIFFSGHGARLFGGFSSGEYLCPVEAEINKIKDTCISDAEFTNALRAIHASRLVVFLDSCHSGGVGEPKDLLYQLEAGLSEKTYNHLVQGEGRVIIASCKSDEVSWELPGMRNGLFTYYLLEGIRGKVAKADGTVRIFDLFSYISEHVPKHKPEQNPFLKSQAENFIVAITK